MSVASLFAQENRHPYAEIKGDPFIQNFNPEDYKAFSQNWQIAQGADGIIYVANNFGLLSYDGVTWKLYLSEGRDVVRAMMIGSQGRIFVGGKADMGYFVHDSSGVLVYHSLTTNLADSLKAPGVVFSIFQRKEYIYFCASNHLYRCDDVQQKMEVILPKTDASQTYLVEDEIYIQI